MSDKMPELPIPALEDLDAGDCFTSDQMRTYARKYAQQWREDAARLDWVVKNRNLRVQGSDESGWVVLDCGDGLTFVTQGHSTYRAAIDAARAAREERG